MDGDCLNAYTTGLVNFFLFFFLKNTWYVKISILNCVILLSYVLILVNNLFSFQLLKFHFCHMFHTVVNFSFHYFILTRMDWSRVLFHSCIEINLATNKSKLSELFISPMLFFSNGNVNFPLLFGREQGNRSKHLHTVLDLPSSLVPSR